MPQSPACVKCGSSEIVPGHVMDRIHNVFNQEQELNLRVDGDPGAFLFTESERRPLRALICGDCGYVEFYASDPATLLAAWRHSQE